MRSLADVRRRLQPGVRLLCVENTMRPELNGRVRLIEKVQTKAFTWIHAIGDRPSWTYLPNAKCVTVVDDDTFSVRLADAYGRVVEPGGHVTLRFLTEEA